MSSLSGKVAIVLGGAKGIGEACVRRMLQEGAKVVIGDVNAERGAATCETLLQSHPQNVFFVHCDVTEDEQIEAVFDGAAEKFGAVDICVVTAGILDEANWKKMMQINLISSLSATYIAQEKMGTKNGGKGGHVVLFSSIAGIQPFGLIPSYSTSKHGILGFTRSMGCEELLEANGVRVNCICPCKVKTDLIEEMTPYPLFPDAVHEAMHQDETFVITVEQVADALMKLLLGNYNGSSMVFTKDGIQAYDEKERLEKFEANKYQVPSKSST